MFKPTTKILAVAVAALAITTGSVQAQTQAVTADVTVLNTLTLAAASDLNWGTIAAVGDTAQTATLAIGTDGVLAAPTSTGGLAVIAVVDNTLATAGQITVADGADGAVVNVDIQNVVDPTDGTDSFTLDTFFTSYNGGADTARVALTPFTVTYDSAFGGGTNTLDIGASLTTIDPSTAYGDGAYAGGFDVVFSY
jgi:hypothetical protein